MMQMYMWYVLTGQRPSFVTQQTPVRQVDPRVLAPLPPTSSMLVRNVPDTFAQPQHTPMQQISSIPQPLPHPVTISGPSFPSQPTPQTQVFTGMPSGPRILPQQPVFDGRPHFPNQNYVGQQQGMNIVRPVAVENMQPSFRTVQPVPHQQPSNQPSMLLQHPEPVQRPPVILQHLTSPASNRLPFEGNVVRTPVSLQSSLPGYVGFGGGEGNQIRFKTGYSSDPEIVGQPIETVIHNRKGPSRPADNREAMGFGQNRAKRFPAAQ